MNIFRRLFRRKAIIKTYAVASNPEGAVLTVWQRGGQKGGILSAIQEKMVHGGDIYQIQISVKRKVNIPVCRNDLAGTVQENTEGAHGYR